MKGSPYEKHVNLSRQAVKSLYEQYDAIRKATLEMYNKTVKGYLGLKPVYFNIDGQIYQDQRLHLVLSPYDGMVKIHIGTPSYFAYLFNKKLISGLVDFEFDVYKGGEVVPFELIELIKRTIPDSCPDFIV